MKALGICALGWTFISTACAWAGVDIRQEQIQFETGKSATLINGTITGSQIVDYKFQGNAGQLISVAFSPNNPSAYFNIMPQDSESAMFIGSISGNEYEGKLPSSGLFTVRVYLMRNAARRKETSHYTIELSLKAQSVSDISTLKVSPEIGLPFDKVLELQGIQFRVTSANTLSANQVQIVPAGLEIDNSPIVRMVDGKITGAEVADLNSDGSPEVYVYVDSDDLESTAALVAYSANRRKSLSEIFLPPITQDKVISKGYRGYDEFAVLEGVLGHRFPIYRDADIDGNPSGGTRQLQYKLVPGEAGWLLKIDKMIEY